MLALLPDHEGQGVGKALLNLVVFSRRKSEQDVRPKKGKMASTKLPETIQSAEGVIHNHKAEDGAELDGTELACRVDKRQKQCVKNGSDGGNRDDSSFLHRTGCRTGAAFRTFNEEINSTVKNSGGALGSFKMHQSRLQGFKKIKGS